MTTEAEGQTTREMAREISRGVVPFQPDPPRAKQLLADAGYPNGFEVTLDCPNNRYVNDEEICIAVAAMLSKIGITTKVRVVEPGRVDRSLGKAKRIVDFRPTM